MRQDNRIDNKGELNFLEVFQQIIEDGIIEFE